MATATVSAEKKPIVKKSAPQTTVADYIVQRLAREGITECFGVAGDFAFKLNDAVVRSETIRWIGCSNELDAAYAADGYARMRGCSMLMTTYAVGELSALNGVMGAKAERSCVFHLVGMPTMRNQRVGKIIHHTLGDGVFQNFANISAQAACVSAVITPDNCIPEMERADRDRQGGEPASLHPGRLRLRGHSGDAQRCAPRIQSRPAAPTWPRPSQAITERIQAARSVAILPAYTVSRFKLQRKLAGADRGAGLPLRRDADGQGRPLRDAPSVCRNVFGRRVVPGGTRGDRGCRSGD